MRDPGGGEGGELVGGSLGVRFWRRVVGLLTASCMESVEAYDVTRAGHRRVARRFGSFHIVVTGGYSLGVVG